MKIPASKSIMFLPTGGILVFIVLYIASAVMYPGGSTHDLHSTSFSLLDNYWCELLGDRAANGLANPGRPIAITAMFVLCLSLAYLWLLAASTFSNPILRKAILLTGFSSFVAATLIFTPFHDLVINVSCALGTVSFLLIFVGLFSQKRNLLLAFGLLCGFLGSANYYIWAGKHFVNILPVLQKVTFLFFLAWFVALNIHLSKRGVLFRSS